MGQIISLAGFMGSGKSSAGKALASMMHLSFVDLDNYIEERSHEIIPAIFETKGNEYFRELEHNCLMELLERDTDSFILALGGGTPCREDNLEAILNKSFCIYLRASEEELVKNLKGTQDSRPMLKSNSIKALLEQRLPYYHKAARLIIDVDGMNEKEVASAILSKISDLSKA